jgi:hypothetical protein
MSIRCHSGALPVQGHDFHEPIPRPRRTDAGQERKQDGDEEALGGADNLRDHVAHGPQTQRDEKQFGHERIPGEGAKPRATILSLV